MNAILSFQNVSKTFSKGAAPLLAGANFEMMPGRTVAVVGRSGSGKSTMLHLAAGIETPTSGDIFIDGLSLGSMKEKGRSRLRRDTIGLVFQFFYLLPHLTLLENVLLPSFIAGGASREDRERATRLLERVGLSSISNRKAQNLSGGEMQRVAICRALSRRPALILADEPTGNLDDETARSVADLLFGMAAEEKSAMLIVTHSTELAAKADEVWRLHGGRFERE